MVLAPVSTDEIASIVSQQGVQLLFNLVIAWAVERARLPCPDASIGTCLNNFMMQIAD